MEKRSTSSESVIPGPPGAPVAATRPAGAGRLYRLAASCPRCGSRPALRVTRDAVEAASRQPPETRLGTYQCQRRGCGEIYDLTAAAYRDAS